MVTYAAVSLMIGLSILKDNLTTRQAKVSAWAVAALQRILFPIAVIAALIVTLSNEPMLTVEALGDLTARLNEWIAATLG
jgi:hypothetical protein